MAQVLPAERGLRRVIGDGATVPDGEVDGLDESDLLALHRQLVLLRTYDECSVVYHRQGRAGTYAVFWNHEAMQAGATYALRREDWIFPSYRESAIGLLRGISASTILSWWRGHPAGWWNPADYNVASICVPVGKHVRHAGDLAWGKKLRGERAIAIGFLGEGATWGGYFHEGDNFAGVMRAPLILFCNNNQWAISTPVAEQTRRDARRQGDRLRIPGPRGRARARRLRGGTRGCRAERAARADLHRGGHVPLGAARDRRRPARLHRSGAGRGVVTAGYEGNLRRLGCDRALAERSRRRLRRDARIAQAGPSRRRIPGSCSSTRTRTRPRRSSTTSPSCGGPGRERWLRVHRRGHQRRLPRRARARPVGDGHGRRRPRRRCLPAGGVGNRFGPDRCVTPLPGRHPGPGRLAAGRASSARCTTPPPCLDN